MDYLQIANENTIPINLQFKQLQESKQSFKNNEKDLFCKIIMGDKSDNISSVFKKCGIKTAEKYYNDKSLFEKRLDDLEGTKKKYNLNKKLIDFNEIPKKYIAEVNSGEYTTIYK
jgi:5'-3' exonuclease